MKIALITTTINVPRVLALYRKHGPGVEMFVTGDVKTPADAILKFCLDHGIQYCGGTTHGNYESIELIGPNSIQRRNFALLEALKWGAEIIVSVDDDNIPLDEHYFYDITNRLWDTAIAKFNGLRASSPTGWFDVGSLLIPQASHRGFPHAKIAAPTFDHVVDARCGVVAGTCMGDPDISAATRIVNGPTVHAVSEVLRAGVVVDPKQTTTVFNSQNTAFIRELAPAMFMLPFVGRFDDIYASLICQRVMREHNYYVHFGKPFCWQQRNQHDLLKDLRGEVDGMSNIVGFAQWLDDLTLGADPVLDLVRYIWLEASRGGTCMPAATIKAALAWCDDCQMVLG